MKIDLFYEIVSQCMINGVRLAAAFFLYRLLSDFVNKKRAFASAVLYLAVLTVLYYIPQILPNLAAYVIAMAAVYIVLIVGDFKKIRLKAFLCITFFALRWLAVGSVSQLMMLINQMTTTLMNNIEIFMTNIPAIIAMFVATEILEVVLCMLFIGFLVKMFLKVYKNACEELTVKEFIMLVPPMLAQVVGYQSVINYYDLYDKAMKAGVIEPVYEFNYTLLAFYLISYGAILVFLMLYQELKKMQENNKEQEILEAQIGNLKNHIDTAMKSYAEIRAMRHDMANHLMVLNELIESGRNEAAEEYSSKLNEMIIQTQSDVKSGNPVTDIVIGEYKDKCIKTGIDFTYDFHYPEKGVVDAFDMSIVLFNALQNACEAAQKTPHGYVSLKAFRKKNAYIIEITNSCAGRITVEPGKLPATDKDNAQAHGYGLKNIKRIAEKYYGGINIEPADDTFKLNIMMMLE